MPRLTKEDRIVRQIIKTHGPIIDLEANPELLIEIVRKYGPDIIRTENGGLSPGGVGPVGPTSHVVGPSIDDVMREVLKLQRQLARLAKQLGP